MILRVKKGAPNICRSGLEHPPRSHEPVEGNFLLVAMYSTSDCIYLILISVTILKNRPFYDYANKSLFLMEQSVHPRVVGGLIDDFKHQI